MELQSLSNGWDSLDRLYGMCLNGFGAKCRSGFCYGSETAGSALFCKKNVIWCFGRLKGSIIRVSGSRQCTKLFSKACKGWLYQICKFFFGKFLVF